MSASAGGIRAGQAYVELLADDSQLRAGLASAQKQLSAWGAQIRQVGLAVFAAGAGMLAPLIAASKQFANSGNSLAKMASRTGMSVEVLSELKHAATLSGASLDDLEKASRRLSVTITSAMNGSQSAIDALGGTKLTKQLAALSTDKQFLAVARAIGQIPDPTRRAAAAVAVFGRSGTMLLPLIEEMDTLRAEARKLGATMSTEQAQKAAKLQDAWERIEGALARITKAMGSALAPALTKVAGDVLPVLVAVKQWIAHNQAVVLTIAKIGAVLAGVGGAIVAFATVITSAAWVFRALGMAVAFVTGTFAVMRSLVAGMTAVWAVLTANILATTVAMRAMAVASTVGATAMAGTRTGILALALAFGGVRIAALAALSAAPALLARIAAGAVAAAIAMRGVTVRGAFGPQRVSYADRGRAVVGAGVQAATGLAGTIGGGLRSAGAALVGLPARIAGAFALMGRAAVAALGSIRTALVGVRVVTSLLGSVVAGAVTRGFAAIPVIAARTAQTIPALIGGAMSAVSGVVASGAGVLGRALMALPGLAVSAGSALVAGLSGAIAAVPGLVFGAIGVMATAIQAIPGLVVGSFAVLRTALVSLPGLFSAAFATLPALIGLALNPVVLLSAGIIGLGVYLYQTTDGGRIALSQLGQAFAEVKDDALTAFSAISDALSAGDIMGAVKILWAFIQVEWTRGIAWMENVMQAFAGGVAKIFLNVGFGINTAFWTVVYGIQTAIDWVVGGIVKVFAAVLNTIGSKVAELLELVGVLDDGASEKIANLSANLSAGVDKTRASRMAERDQKMGDFKALWDEKIQGVNDWMAKGMKGHDAEIAAKRAELDQAIAEVKQARSAKADRKDEHGPGAESGTPGVPELDTAALSADLAARMNTVQLKVDTLGTFNTSAIGEMGVGGTAAERGLQAQEKTARFTERIMNTVESNPMAFE